MTPLEIIAQIEAEAAYEESAKQLDVLEDKTDCNQALPSAMQRNQDRNCMKGAQQSLNALVQDDDLNTKPEDCETDQRF